MRAKSCLAATRHAFAASPRFTKPILRTLSTRDFLAKVDENLVENNKEIERAALTDSFSEESSLKTVAGGYSDFGFFVNDVEMEGSVILLPRSSWLWSPKKIDDVTPDSLKLLGLLEPPLEILLLGTGERAQRPNEALAKHFREMGIVVEQMTTVRSTLKGNISIN
jgi:NADH dehydrogenase [ubiquinone] 1 alpha subcomplex assembly factor 3